MATQPWIAPGFDLGERLDAIARGETFVPTPGRQPWQAPNDTTTEALGTILTGAPRPPTFEERIEERKNRLRRRPSTGQDPLFNAFAKDPDAFERNVEDPEVWDRMAQIVIRAAEYIDPEEDPEQWQQVQQILFSYDENENFRTAVEVNAGSEWYDKTLDRGLFEPDKPSGVVGAAMWGLEKLANVGEGFSTAIGVGLADDEDNWREMLGALGRGLTFQDQPEDLYGYGEQDVDKSGYISPREWNLGGIPGLAAVVDDGTTMNDIDWMNGEIFTTPALTLPGGIEIGGELDVAGVLDFAGLVAVDPLTYITGGAAGSAGRLSKAMMNDIANQSALMRTAMMQMRRGVVRNIDDFSPGVAQQIKDLIEKAAVDTVDSMRRNPRVGAVGRRRAGENLQKWKQKRVAKLSKAREDAINRRAAGGYFFAGMPVPFTRRLSGRWYEAMHNTGWTRRVGFVTSDGKRWLNDDILSSVDDTIRQTLLDEAANGRLIWGRRNRAQHLANKADEAAKQGARGTGGVLDDVVRGMDTAVDEAVLAGDEAMEAAARATRASFDDNLAISFKLHMLASIVADPRKLAQFGRRYLDEFADNIRISIDNAADLSDNVIREVTEEVDNLVRLADDVDWQTGLTKNEKLIDLGYVVATETPTRLNARISTLGRAVRPRAAVKASRGQQIADDVGSAVNSARARAGEISSLDRRALKGAEDRARKVATKEQLQEVNDRLIDQLFKRDLNNRGFIQWMRQLPKELREYAEVFAAIGRESLARNPLVSQFEEGFMPSTSRGRAAVRKRPGARHGLADEPGKATAQIGKQRGAVGPTPEDIADAKQAVGQNVDVDGATTYQEWAKAIEDTMTEEWNIKVPKDGIFENNAANYLAAHSHRSAQLAAQKEMMDRLVKLVDADGTPLVRVVKTQDVGVLDRAVDAASGRQALKTATIAGLKNLEDTYGVKWYVDEATAQAVGEVVDFMNNGLGLKRFGQHVNDMNGLWAGFATLLSPTGFMGFNMRNEFGNIMLNFIGGVKNVARYRDAWELQKHIRAAQRTMVQEGVTWRKALGQIDNAWARKMLLEADAHDIINTSFFADLALEGTLQGDTFWARWNQRIMEGAIPGTKYLSREGHGLRPGHMSRQLATGFENNARLAHFVQKRMDGLSPNAAAQSVKRYLFDYGDLTQFERKYLKSVSRFYTFTRKNFQVQLAALANNPGRIVIGARAEEMMAQIMGGEEETSGILPLREWQQQAGLIHREAGLINIDDPFMQMVETVSNLAGIPLYLADQFGVPRLENLAPESLSDALKDLSGLTAGFPMAAVEYFDEERMERDMFTGAPLPQSGLSQMIRLVDVLMPSAQRLLNDISKLGINEDAWGLATTPEHQRGQTGLRLMSLLSGVNAYAVNEEMAQANVNQLVYELEDILREAEEQGLEVPTITDYREDGTIENMNRILRAIAYAEDDPERGMTRIQVAHENLSKLVNQSTFEVFPELRQLFAAYGIDIEESEQQTIEDEVTRSVEIAEVVELLYRNHLGRSPSFGELVAHIMNAPGAPPNGVFKEFGIEPWRNIMTEDGNRFLAPSGDLDVPTVGEDDLAWMQAMAETYGFTWEQVQEIAPLMAENQRVIAEGQAAGLTPREIGEYLIDDFLNRSQQYWAGIPVDMERYERIDDEEAAKIASRLYEDRQVLEFVAWNFPELGLTSERIAEIMYWSQLNKGEERDLGLPVEPTVPRRDDTRTDAEKAEDLGVEMDAIMGSRSALDIMDLRNPYAADPSQTRQNVALDWLTEMANG